MPTTPDRVRPRFLAPDLDAAAAETRLPPEEARHLTRVLRLGPGAMVAVFDGHGHEYVARVVEARGDVAVVALLEAIAPAAELGVPFVLMQAVLKGAAMDASVRDATMMGAAAIQPVLTQHTIVKWDSAGRSGSLERWRRIAVASAKQSRRATVPDVLGPIPIAAAWALHSVALPLLFVEPSAGGETQPLRVLASRPRPANALLVVGPEGGWAREEIAAAVAAQATLVTLGPLTLRADSMAIVASAMFRMLWE